MRPKAIKLLNLFSSGSSTAFQDSSTWGSSLAKLVGSLGWGAGVNDAVLGVLRTLPLEHCVAIADALFVINESAAVACVRATAQRFTSVTNIDHGLLLDMLMLCGRTQDKVC